MSWASKGKTEPFSAILNPPQYKSDCKTSLRVHSGIQGLDEILGGGFLRKSCVAVSGGPGSGKTTFCIQFLYNGVAEYDEPGIYVTLSENPDEIRENAKSFGWNLGAAEEKKKLKIVDARPVSFSENGLITRNESLFDGEILPFSHIANLVLSEVRNFGAKRLVIDSVTVLNAQYSNEFNIRQGMLGLVQALSSVDCTSLLILEKIGDQNSIPIEWALTHGVIALNYGRMGGDMMRSIQIMKLRGVKHGEKVYGMEISSSGVLVHPDVVVPE